MGSAMSFKNDLGNKLSKANNNYIADTKKKAEQIDEKVLNVCFNDYFARNSGELLRHAESGETNMETHGDQIFQKCVKNIINEPNKLYNIRKNYNGCYVRYSEYDGIVHVTW